MATKKIQSKTSLLEFLSKKLSGSSFNTIRTSEEEIHVDAFDLLSIRIKLDPEKKSLRYELFSPKLDRSVGVERLAGVDFMEAGLEEELEKENRRAVQEDALLALDLIKEWASESKYSVTHYVNPETGQHISPPKKRGPKPKKSLPPK